MTMGTIRQLICDAVEKEYEEANKKYPMFGSMHEGESVIREEIEEVKEALQGVDTFHDAMWDAIRNNRKDESIRYAGGLEKEALELIEEAIQVAAMAEKYASSLDK